MDITSKQHGRAQPILQMGLPNADKPTQNFLLLQPLNPTGRMSIGENGRQRFLSGASKRPRYPSHHFTRATATLPGPRLRTATSVFPLSVPGKDSPAIVADGFPTAVRKSSQPDFNESQPNSLRPTCGSLTTQLT